LKTDNIDGILDCLTYAPKVIEQYGPILEQYTIVGQQEIDADDAYTLSEAELSPF